MIVPATMAHCLEVLANLREQDRKELYALGTNPVEAITAGLGPHAFAWLLDREPAAVFGVAPDGRHGVPWFLATDAIYRAPRVLARYTRPWVEWMQSLYPLLYNVALTENTASLRWLKRAGFELHTPVEINGHEFTPFTRSA